MPPALNMRPARETDLSAIVALLAEDTLGASRERNASPVPQSYRDAFAAIKADPNNDVIVAEWEERVVAVLQLRLYPASPIRAVPVASSKGSWSRQIAVPAGLEKP